MFWSRSLGAWWAACTAPALLVVMLAVTPSANATLADLEHAADAATDAVLEAALRKVLAAMADPQQLRSHLKAAVEEAHPELLAGAADCDLALLRWLQAVATRELWALQSESEPVRASKRCKRLSPSSSLLAQPSNN